MGTKLYVGNLPFNTTEPDLQDLFAQAGTVSEVMLVQDKFTGNRADSLSLRWEAKQTRKTQSISFMASRWKGVH